MLRLNDVQFPEPRKLFPNEQAAHDAMLVEITEASLELQAMGVKPVSWDRYYADTRRLWEKIWRHYA